MRREMLTLADREEISRCLAAQVQQKDIAAAIGRSPSVVCREIARHGGRRAYRAHRADAGAGKSRRRPKCRKIDADPALRERVTADLRRAWSPQQISGRLCCERNRGETAMSISHEAIYTWIYALPKGELAASELALRTGRARRQPRGRARSKGARIVGMTSISQRPDEAEGRKVPGHWEGDLERHEAPCNRAEVEGLRRRAVAAAWRSWGQSEPGERRGGRQAAPTTTGRASTTGWSGSGKRDGKVYERNQRCHAP